MRLNELRSALRDIMETEQAPNVDWARIEARCRETLAHLEAQPAPDYTDNFVYVFLEDPKLRQADAQYARIQHERLKNWLDGSEVIAR
jgi:hypothetical protein